MNVADFDFDLPPELIAQEPAGERAAARLLCLRRDSGETTHTLVSALPELLQAGDVLVVNNTRVFPARLLGQRTPSGGAVECLLIRKLPFPVSDTVSKTITVSDTVSDTDGAGSTGGGEIWEALMHPGQKLNSGARVTFAGPVTIHAEVIERRHYGRRLIRLWTDDGTPIDTAVDAIGHTPLPPYIKRHDQRSDRERYQTVFADRRGSIAAPTAGLHFSEPLLQQLADRGVERVEITLHVGYGTFQPVRVESVEAHRLESEWYEIDARAAGAVNRALDEGRRVVAVGTTTTRALESSAHAHGGRIVAESGATNLFIFPGFQFQVIRGLLTNFHVPRSSLLMLVSAFAGRERVLAAYAEAVARRYRFYSYGDAMLIL